MPTRSRTRGRPPTGRTKALRSHDPAKRAAILEAALDLFVELGFHGTAVPAVAERAGVGAGTIYRYFESKDALVNELYREQKAAITQFVLDGLELGGEPRAVFGAVFQRMCAYVDANAKAYAFLEFHHHAAYLDAASRQAEAQIYMMAETFVRSAQQRGILRLGPPGVLLSLVHGAFVGLVRGRAEGRVGWTDAELQCAENACWDLVAAGATPGP
jgi:AcrR family transcriptional regulator